MLIWGINYAGDSARYETVSKSKLIKIKNKKSLKHPNKKTKTTKK